MTDAQVTGDAYARLMAEAIPTRPAPHGPWPEGARSTWTPEEQEQHVADLIAALDAHDAAVRGRHLHAVPDDETAA